MLIPVRHLLAGSAVAGLLFLLPAGHANAQDNRNTGSWGGAVVVVLSFIAAAGGAVVGVKLASKGKRDEGTMEPTLTQLNSSVKELNEKLTKLEATPEEGVHRLSSTLERKMNLGSVMDTVSTRLETVEQHIIKVEEMVERATGKKEDKQIDLCTSNSDKAIEIHNNQPRPIIIDTNATIDGRIFTLLESDLLEQLRGQVIIAECMTSEMGRLKPELKANGFNNLWSFQNKYKGRIDNNNYESRVTDARLLQLISGTDDKEVVLMIKSFSRTSATLTRSSSCLPATLTVSSSPRILA
ncbi:MAG: hypothetical protein F4Y87_06610 [Synechococcus sp. SB0665_bin_28]|nr:hypothetical protein [Synechococcus sp. SB0665_bin_28]MYF21055.1 hypothetical protein [Synechococcus sp. SB0677_bin_5]